MAGLFDALKQYIADALPGGSLNPEQQPVAERANYLSGLLDPNSQVSQDARNWHGRVQTGLKDQLAGLQTPAADYAHQQMMNMAGIAPLGMIAWHGSPHKFDKFSLDKIGTGEGAQAYGHGLYFAEHPEVAKQYQKGLSDSALYNGGEDFVKRTAQMFRDSEQRAIASGDKNQAAQFAKGAEEWESKLGAIYKTDIPDEAVARFLDWDKPLSQQAPEVQAALKRRITDVKPVDGFDMGGNARLRDNSNGQIDPDSFHPWILEATGANGTSKFGLSQKDVDRMFGTKDVMDLTGEQIISRLAAERGSQGAASDYLKSINVPGIRYLDGGSRGTGTGTSNFVVFDPEMIRILERNGQPTGLQPWKPGEWNRLTEALTAGSP